MLANKNIIITGGSLGIGKAIAEACAKAGARVIIAARNQHDIELTVNELNQKYPNGHVGYSLDISNLEAVIAFSKWCNKELSSIDGLVNNAGVYGPIGKTSEVDLVKFTEAIQINFLGTVYMCSTFAPLLTSGNGRKKIVNYSGGGAATPFANYSAYATSKIAVVRFTENLSIELAGDQIDVNCVAPGFVLTRLHDQTMAAGESVAGKAFFDGTKKQLESGGVPPEKAANLTVFLLSDASDGVTGKFISAPWDPWENEEFVTLLKNDKDFATLRRIDNKTFFKK